jgi:hypothetical protein
MPQQMNIKLSLHREKSIMREGITVLLLEEIGGVLLQLILGDFPSCQP